MVEKQRSKSTQKMQIVSLFTLKFEPVVSEWWRHTWISFVVISYELWKDYNHHTLDKFIAALNSISECGGLKYLFCVDGVTLFYLGCRLCQSHRSWSALSTLLIIFVCLWLSHRPSGCIVASSNPRRKCSSILDQLKHFSQELSSLEVSRFESLFACRFQFCIV